jgi:hypothetical protein
MLKLRPGIRPNNSVIFGKDYVNYGVNNFKIYSVDNLVSRIMSDFNSEAPNEKRNLADFINRLFTWTSHHTDHENFWSRIHVDLYTSGRSSFCTFDKLLDKLDQVVEIKEHLKPIEWE